MMNITLFTDTPELAGEICDEIRLFIPVKRIEYVEEKSDTGLYIRHNFDEDTFRHTCTIYEEGNIKAECSIQEIKPDISDVLLYKKMKKRGAKRAAYECLKKYLPDKQLPWGNLTGIRPTKLYRDTKAVLGDGTDEYMKSEFDISLNKLSLLKKIYSVQRPYIESITKRDIDVYIGIPFCTTKCAYCSFASGLTSKDGNLEKEYVNALLMEMDYLSDILKRYTVRSVYIGGGTPTALNDEQFARVLEAAKVIAKGCKEFTVEAGRPDTITSKKLELIKESGADRISVNAQTANDDTLRRIGRRHTYSDFLRAYELAKDTGLIINTDLILGLPGEDNTTILNSVRKMVELRPDNITLHTLAIKNASKFAEDNQRGFMNAQDANSALCAANELLEVNEYAPYYMYRQKYMTGNLENVGYSLSGKEGVYNIDIMEETASILAFGAGGMSKRVFSKEHRIERTPAVKDILHYVTRTKEMADRKIKLFTD